MIIAIAVAAVVVVIGAYVWLTYNRLIKLALATANSWSQIEVALKLRHALVPALVQVTSGYAAHEKATFERVATARVSAVGAIGAGPARQGPLEGALALGVGPVMGLAEAYPELKADEAFIKLQAELTAVEERILITRRVYNDTVETLNTAVAVFPSVLVAKAFGFSPREFFTTGTEGTAVPVVEIPSPAGQTP